jgi:hypothetical protein
VAKPWPSASTLRLDRLRRSDSAIIDSKYVCLLLLARVIGRIDIDDFRPLAVYVHDRLSGCLIIMVHVRRHRHESSMLKSRGVLLAQFVSHLSMEAARRDGNVLQRWGAGMNAVRQSCRSGRRGRTRSQHQLHRDRRCSRPGRSCD